MIAARLESELAGLERVPAQRAGGCSSGLGKRRGRAGEDSASRCFLLEFAVLPHPPSSLPDFLILGSIISFILPDLSCWDVTCRSASEIVSCHTAFLEEGRKDFSQGTVPASASLPHPWLSREMESLHLYAFTFRFYLVIN